MYAHTYAIASTSVQCIAMLNPLALLILERTKIKVNHYIVHIMLFTELTIVIESEKNIIK